MSTDLHSPCSMCAETAKDKMQCWKPDIISDWMMLHQSGSPGCMTGDRRDLPMTHACCHDVLDKPVWKLLFGQVKGLRPPGRPRSSFNDVALQDCQARGINRPYRDAQDRLLWKDKTCPART